MQESPMFGRLITAIVTPFDDAGNVDFATFAELVEFQFSNGADSLVVCGTTGESPCISTPDKLALFAEAKRVAAGRGSIIANVGGNCTAASIELAREAVALGVDGLLVVVPYYNKPSQEGMFQHFKAIADAAAPVPVIVYNIPGRVVVDMEPSTLVRLANACPNIRAMKQAAVNPAHDRIMLAGVPESFALYSGNDDRTLEMMEYGAVGVISTTSNVAPAEMAKLVNAAASGDMDTAHRMHERLEPLMKGLFEAPNPTLVKEALRLVGRPVGGLRLPLVNATPEQSERLAQILSEVGVR
ncbi:MAG: 4-hydroxy-tetrahydrodipicolinate synthase [Coriobacteriia bacterium]|nr:4-hydroxy-tetrahydrodipicolinate synthase [Coriobacteriia bacterium]